MPVSPLRPCSYPGCKSLVKAGRCDKHQETSGWERDVKRQRLYGRRWQAFRRKFLAENPWCVECQRIGVSVPATEVDHQFDHKGDPVKFWAGPFQALCKSHHSQKTAQELGGGGSQNFGVGSRRARWEVDTKKYPNTGNSGLNGRPRAEQDGAAENTQPAASVSESLAAVVGANETFAPAVSVGESLRSVEAI